MSLPPLPCVLSLVKVNESSPLPEVLESLESKIVYPEEVPLTHWLYPDNVDMKDVRLTPFYVGKAKRLIYGSAPTIVSRSPFVKALTEDVNAFMTATEKNAIPLLPEDVNFDTKVDCSFKVVWNYLNGLNPDPLTSDNSDPWPYPDMSLDDKFMVVYYINHFYISMQSAFAKHYLTSFLTDLHAALEQAESSLIRLAFLVRPFIEKAKYIEPHRQFEGIRLLASRLPQPHKNDMLYGQRSTNIPADQKELPANESGEFAVETLKEAKELYVQAYSTVWVPAEEIKKDDEDDDEEDEVITGIYVPLKSLGVWKVNEIKTLSGETISGVPANELPTPRPGQLPPAPTPTKPSPYGLTATEVERYHNYSVNTFMLIKVTTPQGEIGLYEAGFRNYWLIPSMNIHGENTGLFRHRPLGESEVNTSALLRFFASP